MFVLNICCTHSVQIFVRVYLFAVNAKPTKSFFSDNLIIYALFKWNRPEMEITSFATPVEESLNRWGHLELYRLNEWK